MAMAPISSVHNPWVKRIQKLLQKSRARRQENAFVVEGERELERALVNGYKPQALFVREGVDLPVHFNNLQEQLPRPIVFTNKLFEKISLRSGASKVFGIFNSKPHTLDTLGALKSGVYLIAVGIEKPGNLGALLRTAAGAGLQGVLVVDSQTDLYNPQCIRNSMGGVFSIPIALTDTTGALAFLQEQQCPIFSAALHPKAKNYQTTAYPKLCALAVGNEAAGLPEQWCEQPSTLIEIPMQAPIDSLNVSVAAAVVLYHIGMKQKEN